MKKRILILLFLVSSAFGQVKMPFEFTPGNTSPFEADRKVKARGHITFTDSLSIIHTSTGKVLYHTPSDFTFDGVEMRFITVYFYEKKVWTVEFEGGYAKDINLMVEHLKNVRNFLSVLYNRKPTTDMISQVKQGKDLMGGQILVVSEGKDCITSVKTDYSNSDAFYIHVNCDDVAVSKHMGTEWEKRLKTLRQSATKRM